jgi:integrase/recombinase XerD
VKLPASKNTLAERILTEPDVVRILALEPDRRNQVLLRLLYIAGLRVSEIAALTWRDLQPRTDGGQVTVFGKGSKTRVVLLPSAIWRELLRFRHPSRRSGGHLDQTAVLRIVTKAAARVGAGDTRPRLGGHHWPVPARTADRQLIAIPSGVVMAEVADLAMK